MRLTVLCGTLLALSSLSWIRAEEADLLGDQGFGPCTATLRPEGACRPGQHERTCPYLLSLPPLTVHLPHLRELESIMQDLQKLKDSVDELRDMCADCTESRIEGKCGRQREREHEKQTEGKSSSEDERNWMNVRLEETDRESKQESGNNSIKQEEIDGDNSTEKRLILEEDDRSKWETDRKSNKGVVKEKTLTEVEEKDRKTKKDGAAGKDLKKVPTAGGNTRTVNVTSEKGFEMDRNRDALKGNLKEFQDDKLENAEKRKIHTNVKNKDKTKEESNIFIWQDDVNKMKKTEASDRTKMSDTHEDHINKEHEEETRIKGGQSNEELKQSEGPGHTEKERTVKEKEVDDKDRKTGTEIKAESVQRDRDGELSSRKTTERTDFLSIIPTPPSTTRAASRLDANKVTIFTSSLPSPHVSSSTLSSITDVSHETKGVHGLTRSTSHRAEDISNSRNRDADLDTATKTTLGGNKQEITRAASTVKPGGGLQDHNRMTTPSITTPHQTLYMTELPRVTDRSRWTWKKNISSNIKTVPKPPPGRGQKPGQKYKPGIKPEAEQKVKNPKNDRKPNQAPSPDKKTKYNQKQKPASKKFTAEKSRPDKDSKQMTKPDQRSPPHILSADKNLKNNLTHSRNLTLLNKLSVHKPKSSLKSPTSVQKPQKLLNTSHPDKDHSSNIKSDKTPITDQNSKPEKKLVHPVKTNKPDRKSEKTPESKERTKPDGKFESNQNPKPVQKPDSKRTKTDAFTPKPNQNNQTESVKKSEKNPGQSPGSKPDLKPGLKIISNQVNTTDQMNRSRLEINPKPKYVPEFKSETVTSKPDQNSLTVDMSGENPPHEFIQDLTPGQKTSVSLNVTSDWMNKSSQEVSRVKHKHEPILKPKSETTEPNQNASGDTVKTSDENPAQKSNPDLNPEQKTTSDLINPTSESNHEIPEIKPKLDQESNTKQETLRPHQHPVTEDKSVENSLHEHKVTPDLTLSDRVNGTSGKLNKSREEMFKFKDKPKPAQEFVSENKTFTPETNQKVLSESVKKSNKNFFQQFESNQESKPQQKVTLDQDNITSNQMNKSEFSRIKPKPVREPEFESKTATLKPEQMFAPDTDETLDRKSLQEPESNPDLQSGSKIIFNHRNTTTSQTNKISTSKDKAKTVQEPKPERETTKPTQTSDENPFQKSESSPDFKSGQEIPLDQDNAVSHQKNKSNSEISKMKHQPKPDHEPEAKHVTASLKAEEKSFVVDKSGLTPGQKLTSDHVNATSDQIKKSSHEIQKIKQKPESKSEKVPQKPDQKPLTVNKSGEKLSQESKSNQDPTSGQTPLFEAGSKPSHNVPHVNKKPKPAPETKPSPKHPKAVIDLKNKAKTNLKTGKAPQTDSSPKTPRPDQIPYRKPTSLSGKSPTAESNRTSKPRPPFQHRPQTRPIIKPGEKPKSPAPPKPNLKTGKHVDPPKTHGASSEKIQTSQTDPSSTSGFIKQIAEVTHSPGEPDISFSLKKTITPGPKTSNSLKTGHLPRPHTHAEDVTLSPDSRIVSDLRPQTASQPPSIPMTTRPNKIYSGTFQRVITSTSPGSTHPHAGPKSDSSTQVYDVEESAPATPVNATPRPDSKSSTSTTSKRLTAEPTTPSARELRVKINQVAAFVNNSLNPNERDWIPKELPEGSERSSRPDRMDSKLPTSVSSKVIRDCSDHLLRGKTKSGVYLVTPDLRSRSFTVFCDMELDGGGWTVLQRRQDGSVSFNRSWTEYQSGFGVLNGGEFWLGNTMIHLLTRDRDMLLRVELEDFDGATGYAQYEQFRVAGERQRYRLTVGGYSGTAGDALRFSKRYDHNNKAFSTPDRDHDRYPSGNCGAYYSSGWWFDACMAANLNGKYYVGKYHGVRDGIFWGTWYNISEEYYPTNERQSFKSVRMMIRPKSFVS